MQQMVRDPYAQQPDILLQLEGHGIKKYYSVTVDGKLRLRCLRTNRDCAWSVMTTLLEEPNEAAQKIRGRIAFWNGVKVVP